jgi:predicted Zn-dependent peptidase
MDILERLRRQYSYTEEVFENGNVLFHFSGDYPISCYRILIPTGSNHARSENGIIPGLPHFFEHMMMSRTAAHPGNQEFAKLLGMHGGGQNAQTSGRFTTYIINVPSQHAALGQQLLTERVLTPLFTEEDLLREKGVIATERDGRRKFWPGKSPSGQYYNTEFMHDQVMSWQQVFGEDHDFDQITCDVLRSEHARQLATGGLIGVSVGPEDPQLLREALSGITTDTSLTKPTEHLGTCTWKRQEYHTKACSNIRQPSLEVAWLHQEKFTHEQRRAVLFMQTMMTNTTHGVMWERLRIDQGLIYSLDSHYSHDTTYTTFGFSFPLRSVGDADTVRTMLPGLLDQWVTNQDMVEQEIERGLSNAAYWFETSADIVNDAVSEIRRYGRPMSIDDFIASRHVMRDPAWRQEIASLMQPELYGELLFVPES